MTEKSFGMDREDARLLPRLSTTKSTAPVTTAGRELDALVAEKVMGWGDTRYDHTVPLYSTSLADAWLVVEKLGGEFRCVRRSANAEFGVALSDGGNGWGEARSLALPLAICLAALKAVGG